MRAGVHELCPLLKDDARARHRRPQRHPPRSARLAPGQSAPAASATAASCTPARGSPRSSGDRGAWHVTTESGERYSRADPGQCRGRLGRPGRGARRRAAARASSPSAARSSPSMRRPAPSSIACRSPRRSATSSISRRRAGGCSLRRWTKCRATRATPSPTNMRSRWPRYRMEERTTVKVERIHSRWAGLRTFTPDRHPAVGFAPDAEGFFWLAGQGGFGLQTSPAMARDRRVADRRRRRGRSPTSAPRS